MGNIKRSKMWFARLDQTRPDLPKAVFKVFETIDAFEETGNPVAIVRRSNDSSMI